MPTRTGKDKDGCFAQWGSGAKYHYKCSDKEAEQRAKNKADKQGQAAHINGYSAFMAYVNFIKNNDNSTTK